MKNLNKYVKYYGILWILGYIVFNVVTFVIPHNIGGVDRLQQNGFWLGYALMTLAFLGQIACTYILFRSDSNEKVFLNISMIKVEKSIFTVSVIISIVFTLVPKIPLWLGSIICLLALFVFVLWGVRARVAYEAVTSVGERVSVQSSFIVSLRADAQALMSYAKTEDSKKATKEIYEALKYSDPISSEEVDETEQDIFDLFGDFSAKIKNGDFDEACIVKDNILDLIKERNIKVKLFKR